MNKVKNELFETLYLHCYTSLSHEMNRLYWTAIRGPLLEDARDSVYNVIRDKT